MGVLGGRTGVITGVVTSEGVGRVGGGAGVVTATGGGGGAGGMLPFVVGGAVRVGSAGGCPSSEEDASAPTATDAPAFFARSAASLALSCASAELCVGAGAGESVPSSSSPSRSSSSSSSSLHSASSSSYSGLSTELSRKSPTASPAFAAAALALAARPESAPCSIRGRDSPSEANGPRFSLLAFLANFYVPSKVRR